MGPKQTDSNYLTAGHDFVIIIKEFGGQNGDFLRNVFPNQTFHDFFLSYCNNQHCEWGGVLLVDDSKVLSIP